VRREHEQKRIGRYLHEMARCSCSESEISGILAYKAGGGKGRMFRVVLQNVQRQREERDLRVIKPNLAGVT
jgi:hypothetical protein